MEKNRLVAKEAFALRLLRRSNYTYDIVDWKLRFGLPELLEEGLVYHLERSSFNPYYLERCFFRFDTTSSEEDYIIHFTCPFSSDDHGIEEATEAFRGESYETGTLVIDRSSFAFKRIERNSFRNKNYKYPRNNNLNAIGRNYWMEFVAGRFIVEYEPNEEKWFLNKLLYSYTNDFFRAGSGSKDFTITENFEWQVDSVSRYIDKSLVGKFYTMPSLVYPPYTYDSSAWTKLPAFYFQHKEAVYKDLQQKTPIEDQFRKNSKGRDY